MTRSLPYSFVPSGTVERTQSDLRFAAVVVAMVALALCLRLYGIHRHEVWHDEAISFHMATHSDWLQSARLGSHPPLYYLLLRAWVPIAGSSPTALRLPSAIFGTLSIFVLIGLGREVFNREVGLWAGAFATIAPIHIYYSQEARNYALLILVLLLTLWALWKAMQQNTWKRWALVFIGTLIAFYVHLFSVLALLPTLLLPVFWAQPSDTHSRWTRFVFVALSGGLLLAPWVLWTVFWLPFAHETNVGFVATIWQKTPPALAIPKSIEALALGFHKGFLPAFFKGAGTLQWPVGLRGLGLGVVVLLAILIVVPWGDGRLGIPFLGKRKTWVASLTLFPLLVMWLASLYKPIFIVGRYDIIVFPGFALLVGLSFAKLRRIPRIGAAVCCAAALIFAWVIGNKLARYYQTQPTSYASATADMLHRSVADGDVVVFTGGYGAGVDILYYLYRLGYRDPPCSRPEEDRHFTCRMFPRDHHEYRFLGYHDERTALERRQARDFENAARDYVGSLKNREGGIWLVLWNTGSRKGRGRVTPGGKTTVTRGEAALMQSLETMGFAETFAQNAPWIFRFKVPTSSAGSPP